MMKWILLVFLCLTACQPSLSPAEPSAFGLAENHSLIDPSLVTISSEYQDQSDSKRKSLVHGSGFLVQVDEKLFVVTAAHVSQGQNLKMTAQDQLLEIKGRYYDGISDIEVIEVDSKLKTTLVLIGNEIIWKNSSIPRAKWADRFNFVPLNSWITDTHLETDNAFLKTRSHEVHCDLYCYMLHAETLMQPGSSGSPLISRVPTGEEWSSELLPTDLREGLSQGEPGSFRVRGFVIRRERFFSRSAFVPLRSILESLGFYLKGQRTDEKKIESRWYLNGSLLVRGSDRYIESGAVAGSSGNGVSMDGGDLNEIDEEEPKKLFDQVKAFASNGQSEKTFWITMMRHPSTSQMISFPTWFDIEEHVRLRRFVMGVTPEDPTNIIANLFGRFGAGGPPPQMTSTNGQGLIKKGDRQATLRLQTETDTIEFTVNREGFVCQTVCSKRFDPIAEVTSLSGEPYLIDVRQLFFVDHNLSKTDLFRNPKLKDVSKKEFERMFFDEMIRDGNVIQVSIRKKRRGLKTPMTVEQGRPVKFEWVIP